jgi:GT2 family glycosyltransferase
VVDNGSGDHSSEIAQSHDVRLEFLGRNHGLASAYNLGAARAHGDILVFVNNDMRFDRSFMTELVGPLLERDDVFATDARQLDWEGKREVHGATRLSRRRLRAAFTSNGSFLPRWDIEQLSIGFPSEAVQASGANIAVRRDMFEELGGFDGRLTAGWEDTDICWRAWLRGWRTLFVPKAVCWHRVGASSDAGWWRYRGTLGGRLLFATKHLPIEDALLTWGYAIGGGLREAAMGRGADAMRRISLLWAFGRHAPKLLAERRRIYRQAGRSPHQHLLRLAAIGRQLQSEPPDRREPDDGTPESVSC